MIANEGALVRFDLTEEGIAANPVVYDPAANSRSQSGDGVEPAGTLQLDSAPTSVVAAEGTIWVSTYFDVRALDIASGAVLGTIPQGAETFYDVAVDTSGVWLSNHAHGVAHGDPATFTLVAEPVFEVGPSNLRPEIAIGDGSVWVATYNQLYQVDPATATEVRRIPEAQGEEVAAGEGAVWVGHSIANTVTRVDPASGAVTVLTLDSAPEAVAAGAGFAWAALEDGNGVAKIDPVINQVVSTISFPFPTQLFVANGFLWVANEDGTIGRIDPATDHIDMFHLPGNPTVVGIAVT